MTRLDPVEEEQFFAVAFFLLPTSPGMSTFRALSDEESLGGCIRTGTWEVPPFNCLPFLGSIVLIVLNYSGVDHGGTGGTRPPEFGPGGQ